MNSDTHTETEPIRVLLASYPVLMRHALRRLIEAGESLRVVAEAATVDEIAEHAHRSTVDVIAVDSGIPGFDELGTTPDAPETVVIADHDGVAELHRALRIGAYGHVTSNDDPEVLYLALRAAASGQRFLSPRVTRTVLDSLVQPDPPPADTAAPGTAGTTVAARDTDADRD